MSLHNISTDRNSFNRYFKLNMIIFFPVVGQPFKLLSSWSTFNMNVSSTVMFVVCMDSGCSCCCWIRNLCCWDQLNPRYVIHHHTWGDLLGIRIAAHHLTKSFINSIVIFSLNQSMVQGQVVRNSTVELSPSSKIWITYLASSSKKMMSNTVVERCTISVVTLPSRTLASFFLLVSEL